MQYVKLNDTDIYNIHIHQLTFYLPFEVRFS